MDAPLVEEEIVIERRVLELPRLVDEQVHPFTEFRIDIPIRGEEIVVNRRTVVREEIVVHRERRERRRPMSS